MADPTGGQIGQAYLELPYAIRGELSFAEFELPHGHTGDISWAELQVADIATAGQLAFTKIETPNVATAGAVAVAELKTSNVATGGQIGQVWVTIPFFPTAGQAGWAEFVLQKAPTAGRIGLVNLEIPRPLTAAVLAFAEAQLPKTYAASFQLSNGTVGIFRAANLTAIQPAGQITQVGVTSPGVYYVEPGDILVTAIHSDDSGDPDDAVLTANIGALTTKAGTYRTTKGFLSADKFLQDESYYNDHTYVVRVAESFDRWKLIFKKILHPAGFKLIGEFVLITTPDTFALTPEDVIVIES
jgi:hypothetical protein